MARIRLRILGLFVLALSISYLIYSCYFKYYWHDEAIILLHLSGYKEQDLIQSLYDGTPKTAPELQKFQGVNQDKNIKDMIESLAKTSAHQPPLYFLLLWVWAKLFGNVEVILRSLSIGIWLGFLACLYQFSLILSQNRNAAFLSTFIVALSPRFLSYAVDLREYGLFALVTVSSCWLFLKAFEAQNSLKNWIYYGLSLVAGLYTHIFFGFVFITHFIYFWMKQSSLSQLAKKYYFLGLGFSLLVYSPWLYVLIKTQAKIYGWAQVKWDNSEIFTRWINTITELFYEFKASKDILQILNIILFLLIIFSLYSLKKSTLKHQLFLWLLIIVPWGLLVSYDLLFQSRYSTVGRFYIPSLIGILVSVSLGLYPPLFLRRKWEKIISYLGIIFLILLPVSSQWINLPLSPEQTYRGYGSNIINSYLIINQSKQPLIIGESWLDILPLSYKLSPEANYLLVKSHSKNLANMENKTNYSELYVINPSSSLRKAFELAAIKLEKTDNNSLWKIKL